MAQIKFYKTPDRIYLIEWEMSYQGRSASPVVDAYLTERAFLKRIAWINEQNANNLGYTCRIVRTLVYEPKVTNHGKRTS